MGALANVAVAANVVMFVIAVATVVTSVGVVAMVLL